MKPVANRYTTIALPVVVSLENARALLNANSQIKGGVGNRRDLVGRFFMEHPTFVVGQYVLTRKARAAVFPIRTNDSSTTRRPPSSCALVMSAISA